VGDDEGAELGELLPAGGPAPEEEVELALREQVVRDVVSRLPDRERTVIKLRYGLDGDPEPVPVTEVARRLELRPSEVKKLERGALAELAVRRELEALDEAA
jgi:RNA polymerase primary sigma factor